ncbi:MAG: type II toxin-antitoxin system RelE/ParE family toxin [Cytophagales bacterium]|nr:type II toxin-antitoxin system RelE/ParE family toxin [Cytophagales bacterium]
MLNQPKKRVFKTAWFTKAAKKAHITDAELCAAIAQVMEGKADDLGSGVFKKRLNDNMHRSIILTQSGRGWVYQYLFAKKDRDNIDNAELRQFRALAKIYAKLTKAQVNQLIEDKEFLEIFHDNC